MKRWLKKSIYDIGAIFCITIFLIALCNQMGWFINTLDGDMGGYVYGLKAGLAKILADGEFPYWFPFAWGGCSTGHAYFSTYDPVMLILELLCWNKESETLSFVFVCLASIVHFWFYLVGIYFISHEIIGNRIYAMLSTCLSGTTAIIFCTSFSADAMGIAYLPLVIYCTYKAIHSNSMIKWEFVAGLFMAFTISSSPAFGTATLLLAYALFWIANIINNLAKWKNITLKMIISGILCLCFSAFSLLDFVAFTKQSIRQVGEQLVEGAQKVSFEEFVAHPGLFESLRDIFLGNEGYNTLSINLVVVSLILFGICRKNKTVFSRYAIIQLVVVVAYGCSVVMHIIFYNIPVYNQIREQYLYMMLIPLPLSILIAEGVSGIMKWIRTTEESKDKEFNCFGYIVILIVFVATSQLLYPLRKSNANLLIIFSAIIGSIGICIIKMKRKYVGAILISITVLINLVVNVSYLKNNLFTGKTIAESTHQVSMVQDEYEKLMKDLSVDGEEGWGVLRWCDNSPCNILFSLGYKDEVPYLNPVMKKIRYWHSYMDWEDSLVVRNVKYIMINNTEDEGIKWWNNNLDSLDYLEKVVDNKEMYSSYDANEKIGKNIYLNNNRAGVAWFVQSYLTYNDDMSREEVAMLINSEEFTPLTVAAVNTDTCNMEELSRVEEGTDLSSKVELKEYKHNSFTLETESECTRLMSTSEVFANGWKCYIDGKRTNIIEVNYGFKGIVVPEGIHNISFVYTPPYLIIEIGLTIFGFLIIIIGIILERRKVTK